MRLQLKILMAAGALVTAGLGAAAPGRYRDGSRGRFVVRGVAA